MCIPRSLWAKPTMRRAKTNLNKGGWYKKLAESSQLGPPWWWSRGQWAFLLLWQSCWSLLQFFLLNLCLKRMEMNKNSPGLAYYLKNPGNPRIKIFVTKSSAYTILINCSYSLAIITYSCLTDAKLKCARCVLPKFHKPRIQCACYLEHF